MKLSLRVLAALGLFLVMVLPASAQQSVNFPNFCSTGSRPATPTASFTVDLPTVLGTTNAFVGFTSGTGSGGNTHDILSWQLIGAFAPFPGGPAANVPTLSPVMLSLLAAGLAIAVVLLLKRL